MKKCNKCNEEKPLDQFTFADKKRGYYKSYCRECCKQIISKHYQENKETYRYNSSKWIKNNPERFKKIKSKYMKVYSKKWHKKHEDGLHRVYYIPEHHYVGVTDNLYHRMNQHKNTNNRILDGFEIIYSTPHRNEALKVESKLHSMGYQG